MKNIIVTGTSRGIGSELVLKFAQNGYHVMALSRKKNPLFENNPHIKEIYFDICNHAHHDELKKYLTENQLRLDIIIHNAGALINKPFAEISASEFEYLYKVNVLGIAMLNQMAIPYLNKNSHVVTISSMGGVQGSAKFAGLSAYSSSKAAAITLSELLAEEYKNDQIAFNVLALGAVQTEMLAEAFPGYLASILPKDMANYIYDFALNGNRFFNGKILEVSTSTP